MKKTFLDCISKTEIKKLFGVELAEWQKEIEQDEG